MSEQGNICRIISSDTDHSKASIKIRNRWKYNGSYFKLLNRNGSLPHEEIFDEKQGTGMDSLPFAPYPSLRCILIFTRILARIKWKE